MSDLVSYCSGCAKEVKASQRGRDGLCAFCLTDEAISPLLAEYRRLWAKRQRYLGRGVDARHCERQLSTVARRVGDQVHRRLLDPTLAIPVINGHLDAIRRQVEHPGLSRLVLA